MSGGAHQIRLQDAKARASRRARRPQRAWIPRVLVALLVALGCQVALEGVASAFVQLGASRDPHNPLELNPAPTDGNPLQGARFYVDRWGSPAGKAELAEQRSNPAWASAISVIASQRESG